MQSHFVPTLETVLDETYMCERLIPVIQERFGSDARVCHLAIERLHTRLMRYTAQILDLSSAQTAVWKFIGKAYSEASRVESSFEMMQQLWDHGFSREASDRISIPEPLHSFPDVCLVLMEEVPGVPLKRLMKMRLATPDDMCQVARAFVKLHQCTKVQGTPFTVEDELLKCRPQPQILAQHYPELAGSIHYIIETAKILQKSCGDKMSAFIHGDFHLGQAHIENGHMWILDLDSLKTYDPAYDLAELFVVLKRTEKRKSLSNYIETLRDAFLSEYFSKMDWEIAERIPLSEALIHLKRACKRLRVQDEAGWEEKIRRLVNQAVICIQVVEQNNKIQGIQDVIDLYHRSPGAL